MAKKDNILVLHPRGWAIGGYSDKARFKYHHCYIGAPVPRKRSGEPTYDGYADVATPDGKQIYKQMVTDLKPKAVLIWMHADLPTAFFEWTKNQGSKVVHWYGNHRNQLAKGVQRVMHTVDVLLINSKDPRQINMFKNTTKIKNVHCLYDGFEPGDVHYNPVKEEYDCFFGGNTYLKKAASDDRFRFPRSELRFEFIYQVAKKYNLALHSDQAHGWGKVIKPLTPVFHPKYHFAMRKARITLNVNHFDFYKAYTRRTIRSLFAGRAHVTSYIPGMEDDFEFGKHMMWFRTVEEGLDQIDYLLKDKKRREFMAQESLKMAMDKHQFKHRLVEFEKILEESGI